MKDSWKTGKHFINLALPKELYDQIKVLSEHNVQKVATFCIYTLTKRCREEYPLLTGIEYKPNIPAKEVTEVEEDLIETLKLPELPELTDLEDF